jgi:hypothetical protein
MQAGIVGKINRSHAAFTKQPDYLVLAQTVAGLESVFRRRKRISNAADSSVFHEIADPIERVYQRFHLALESNVTRAPLSNELRASFWRLLDGHL